ncbi:IPExxxVDY family protein [Fulvivirga sp.]|uniref:IPExxxVDY family protein n=1 Tax=Fulvivirga sp. TaxID=1931237 RepID=UPI0032EDEE6A
MKKTKLLIDYEYDFELFGIASSARFFKLAWAINSLLSTRLVKLEDYTIDFEKGESINFINYCHEDESCLIHLFKNKSPDYENKYLLPEMTHFDFILKINGSFQTFAAEEVIKELREVKYIEYIAPIALEKLKSKDNFLN